LIGDFAERIGCPPNDDEIAASDGDEEAAGIVRNAASIVRDAVDNHFQKKKQPKKRKKSIKDKKDTKSRTDATKKSKAQKQKKTPKMTAGQLAESMATANRVLENASCAPVHDGPSGQTSLDKIQRLATEQEYQLLIHEPAVTVFPDWSKHTEQWLKLGYYAWNPALVVSGVNNVGEDSNGTRCTISQTDLVTWFDQNNGQDPVFDVAYVMAMVKCGSGTCEINDDGVVRKYDRRFQDYLVLTGTRAQWACDKGKPCCGENPFRFPKKLFSKSLADKASVPLNSMYEVVRIWDGSAVCSTMQTIADNVRAAHTTLLEKYSKFVALMKQDTVPCDDQHYCYERNGYSNAFQFYQAAVNKLLTPTEHADHYEQTLRLFEKENNLRYTVVAITKDQFEQALHNNSGVSMDPFKQELAAHGYVNNAGFKDWKPIEDKQTAYERAVARWNQSDQSKPEPIPPRLQTHAVFGDDCVVMWDEQIATEQLQRQRKAADQIARDEELDEEEDKGNKAEE